MKYRGIELLASEDSAAELLVHVLIPEEMNDGECDYWEDGEFMAYEFCSDLEDFLKDNGISADMEHEIESLICVRSRDRIPFDRAGVDILLNMYEKVKEFVDAHGDKLYVKIGVHVDGPGEAFCFFNENGDWYNEDSATPDEFLERIEY